MLAFLTQPTVFGTTSVRGQYRFLGWDKDSRCGSFSSFGSWLGYFATPYEAIRVAVLSEMVCEDLRNRHFS
jgi:hypothetical protein